MAVLSIAGTVGVFIAMVSLARGFRATLVTSGSTDNALILRAGSLSEMMGAVTLDSVKIIKDGPGVARDSHGAPLVTQEVVGVMPFPLVSNGADANTQVRGVSPNVLEVRRTVKITEGRMLQPGLAELVVGKNAARTYRGLIVGANNSKTLVPLAVGNTVDFGGGHWKIVGIFDAGGSAFDSEIWCDAPVLNEVLKRPDNLFQSVTAHLTSVDAFDKFKDALTTDPRMNVDVTREVDYYAKQSRVMTTLITVLGGFVAAIMAIGAVFGALNTMYSAVSERGREIATMRAVGFAGSAVVFSFLVEALLISLVGGLLGCIAVLPLNGLTTSTMNFQTFSNLAFAFKITLELLIKGIFFALVMGVIGGLLPAIRAAAQPVASALRSL